MSFQSLYGMFWEEFSHNFLVFQPNYNIQWNNLYPSNNLALINNFISKKLFSLTSEFRVLVFQVLLCFPMTRLLSLTSCLFKTAVFFFKMSLTIKMLQTDVMKSDLKANSSLFQPTSVRGGTIYSKEFFCSVNFCRSI